MTFINNTELTAIGIRQNQNPFPAIVSTSSSPVGFTSCIFWFDFWNIRKKNEIACALNLAAVLFAGIGLIALLAHSHRSANSQLHQKNKKSTTHGGTVRLANGKRQNAAQMVLHTFQKAKVGGAYRKPT